MHQKLFSFPNAYWYILFYTTFPLKKRLGHEEDLKKFKSNGEILDPKKGYGRFLNFSETPAILYQKYKFLAVNASVSPSFF